MTVPALLWRLVRSLAFLAVLLALTLALLRAVPGGPFDHERAAAPEVQAALAERYGMERSFLVTYRDVALGMLRGDFGPSMHHPDRDVAGILADAAAITLPLAALSLSGAMLLAALAAILATRAGGPWPGLLRALSSLGLALPKFALAPLLVLLFAVTLKWLPAAGLSQGWRSWLLPVLALTLPQAALLTRAWLALLAAAMVSEPVRMAAMRGYGRDRVLLVHAARLAAPGALAFTLPVAVALFTGSAVIESVFQLPGLGLTLVKAAQNRDHTLVLGVVMVVGALIQALVLVSDLLHRWLEPRLVDDHSRSHRA